MSRSPSFDAVAMRDVSKAFGPSNALCRVSFTVRQHAIFGFIGPNGSGKTTTLRILMDILRPDSGSVRVLGSPPRAGRALRVGYLPEERGIYPRMRVREALEFYGGLRADPLGVRRADLRSQIDGWLNTMGLLSRAHMKVEALSKGMRQKVQLITTLVPLPDLLILDEPFAGLDPVNAKLFRKVILDLRAAGTTVLLSTHDMALAESMCDHVCMILEGQVVLDGTLRSIRAAHPSNLIRIVLDDPAQSVRPLPAIRQVVRQDRSLEIHLAADADPDAVAKAILPTVTFRQCEIANVSLHDIFLQVAGSAAPQAKAHV